MPAETFWIELGFLPAEVGYVPTKKAWDKTLAEHGFDPEPFPDTDGRCVWYDNVGATKTNIILITVGKRCAKYTMAQVCGIISHECMHAWRFIREAMGETEPSLEFEAYAMQALVQGTIHAHQTSRKRPWK